MQTVSGDDPARRGRDAGVSKAFSSEVGTASRQENATTRKPFAFSSEVGTASRQENATTRKPFAFSSEVGTASRQDNATTRKPFAFSSEVGTASRQENATTRKPFAFSRLQPDRISLDAGPASGARVRMARSPAIRVNLKRRRQPDGEARRLWSSC
jgi:hypothetical protein